MAACGCKVAIGTIIVPMLASSIQLWFCCSVHAEINNIAHKFSVLNHFVSFPDPIPNFSILHAEKRSGSVGMRLESSLFLHNSICYFPCLFNLTVTTSPEIVS